MSSAEGTVNEVTTAYGHRITVWTLLPFIAHCHCGKLLWRCRCKMAQISALDRPAEDQRQMNNSIDTKQSKKPGGNAPRWLKTLFTRFELLRVAVAQLFLPRKCYVQIKPNMSKNKTLFPGLDKEIKTYNHDTSLAQRSLCVDGNRVIMLRRMLKLVESLPDGDYAELGTYRGISGRLIYKYMAPNSELHCFDTFDGFDDGDVHKETKNVQDRGIEGAFGDTSLQLAERYILNGASDQGHLFMHQGYFPETFKGLESRTWRFVHLDPDLYLPTLEGLKHFYPQLVPGGVILLHDYYSFFTGVRRAVEEFLVPQGIVVVPLGDKAGTGAVFKSETVLQAA